MDIREKIQVRKQRFKYVAVDWIATSVAFLIFDIYRYRLHSITTGSSDDLLQYISQEKLIAEQILVPLIILAVNWFSGYYNRLFGKSRLWELTLTLESSLVNAGWIFLVFLINDHYALRLTDYLVIIVLFSLLFLFTYIGRLSLTMLWRGKMLKSGQNRNVLIVGSAKKVDKLKKKLEKSKTIYKYHFIGFIPVDDAKENSGSIDQALDKAEQICRLNKVDEVILAPDKNPDILALRTLSRLFPFEIPIKIMPDTLSYVTQSIHTDNILEEPMIDLTRPRLSDCEKNVKRTFDIVMSGLMLLLLSPLILAIAIAVKSGSPGPIIYSQQRVGKRRKPFRIYKFRTMHTDAEASGPALSSADDSRVTRVGKILRKYRLDELPQFWNVIRGDMSIVGPRPEREYYIKQILRDAPYYALTFQVRPGITSWGMVKFGYASTISQMLRRTKFDLIYITNMSLTLDLKIMIHTIHTIVKGAGV